MQDSILLPTKLTPYTSEATPGTLADRIMSAPEAGKQAGGDRRGRISETVLALNEVPCTNGCTRNIDPRIDSSNGLVGELRMLFEAYRAAFKIQ